MKWIPPYLIRKPLLAALSRAGQRAHKGEIRVRFLPQKLTLKTYTKFFRTLLHLEEWQERLNVEKYETYDAVIKAEDTRHKYRLQVQARLQVGGPLFRVDDVLLLRKIREDGLWHRAVVIKDLASDLLLYDMSKEFKPGLRHEPVRVMFAPDRTLWRRCHHAIARSSTHQPRLLFPTVEHVLRPQRLTTEEIDALDVEEDSSLISNPEQREVVAAIVTAPGGSVPFMIFGPPGTGKTVTVVKAALQVLKSNPDARLLMCAPTNEAADLLAFKMAELGPTQLLRLNAVKRPVESESTLQAALKQFSIFGADGAYTIPDAVHLQSRRVVVTTCVSAAMPYCLGVEPGWFTHIFIDEAGQCVEPEAMIPVKLLAGENTNVVLAGDVKQLGPVIHSDYSRDLGLKQSYMERLSNMPVYDLETYRGVTIVKLVKHFRSHPAIISFSNKKFYGDELEPCSDEAITHGMLHSVVLDGLNPKFPVVFHGISGQEKHEEDTPSYFNAQEASLVVRYCKALVNDPRARISAKDIGVVSPYNGQCRMIRTLLQRSSRQMDGLRVGPTEAFQGQDRRVIIISTVRSNRFLADIRQRLGFVADPQRLNVAITRARALLIVIGDPDVLALDDVWREFMAYVKANGGWRGKGVSEAHIYGPNAEDTTTAAVRRIDEQINEV